MNNIKLFEEFDNTDLIETIKEILLPFTDDNIKVKVTESINYITIEIGEEHNHLFEISPKNYEDTFDTLFNFLELEQLKIIKSLYKITGEEFCPKCDSYKVNPLYDELSDEYDYSTYQCNMCDYMGSYDEFSDTWRDLTKESFKKIIKNNITISYIEITLKIK